ncbi:MAG: DMT family transporter [Spirochaetales bacterium]
MLLLSLFFGTNLVVSRFGLGQFHPVGFVALRMPIAAALCLLWVRLQYGRLPRGRDLWLHGSLVGVFATAIPMLCFVSALLFQSSGVTALMITLVPVAAMLYGHVRLEDDPLTPRKILGAVVSFAGVGLLLITGQTGVDGSRWEGFALVMVGVASAGYGIVHLRKHLRDERSLDLAAVRLTAATAVTVPVALFVGGYDLAAVEWSGIAALIYGVLPGTLFGFVLYSYLVARFGPSKATQSEYVVPVIATITGAIFLEERVTIITILGMITVFAGIAIATARRAAPVKAIEKR